ncbi:molecular chaperone [Enterobacter sp. ENT02]|uniref:fimbrial biogenesis chaperone n=1 Tax=Enterobacter sp. ENT02 TaxID=2854767 RepID=UPI001C45BA10|nr:molecular chaperone [Enterobacter sp. ENT02]MBV7559733.1 molecular chaperone [Enterobacter sp. ENT02]
MKFSKVIFCILINLSVIGVSKAGVVIGGTRVIYDGTKKEASLTVENNDKIPYLIQSWVEKNEEQSDSPPFIITPPLYRLDGGRQTVQRILLTGSIAQDKESLYWINVKSIPASEMADNTLQIAVKTRMKLIYRPKSLVKEDAEQYAESLKFSISGNKLIATNTSNYVMNIGEIKIDDNQLDDALYVLPGKTKTLPLSKPITSGMVKYKLINDSGALGKEHISKI